MNPNIKCFIAHSFSNFVAVWYFTKKVNKRLHNSAKKRLVHNKSKCLNYILSMQIARDIICKGWHHCVPIAQWNMCHSPESNRYGTICYRCNIKLIADITVKQSFYGYWRKKPKSCSHICIFWCSVEQTKCNFVDIHPSKIMYILATSCLDTRNGL